MHNLSLDSIKHQWINELSSVLNATYRDFGFDVSYRHNNIKITSKKWMTYIFKYKSKETITDIVRKIGDLIPLYNEGFQSLKNKRIYEFQTSLNELSIPKLVKLFVHKNISSSLIFMKGGQTVHDGNDPEARLVLKFYIRVNRLSERSSMIYKRLLSIGYKFNKFFSNALIYDPIEKSINDYYNNQPLNETDSDIIYCLDQQFKKLLKRLK